MTNKEKYKQVFQKVLSLETDVDEDLQYNDIVSWDSVGHMMLIAELEQVFEIQMDPIDMIEFRSYQKGKEILKNYGVEF